MSFAMPEVTAEELRETQLASLRTTLRTVYEKVPHYRHAFDEAGVHPDDLTELADLARFPFTTKEDLRRNYPFGMFVVPREELARVVSEVGRGLPLMANMVEGGKTPIVPAAELQALGFSLVIFPGGIVRALAKAAQDYYGSLKAHGSTDPFRARMFDFDALNAVIGTPEMLARSKRYAGDGPGSK